MSYALELARVQEQIRVRKFCYRTRILMLWLLALGCWIVPWYTAIPIIFCALMTAGWAWYDTRVYYRLVDHRSKLFALGERGPSDGVFR